MTESRTLVSLPSMGETVQTPLGFGTVVDVEVRTRFDAVQDGAGNLARAEVTVWYGSANPRRHPAHSGKWTSWTWRLAEISWPACDALEARLALNELDAHFWVDAHGPAAEQISAIVERLSSLLSATPPRGHSNA